MTDTVAPAAAEESVAVAARTRRERKAQAWRGRICENCDTVLQGPFCHRCGQPEKTPIRNLLALSGDAFDYLFDVDARVWRTLTSLFFRPGRLTELYLRGQRMSFVRPLRIYLVVSALLFVVVTSMSDLGGIMVSDDGDIELLDGNPGGPDLPVEAGPDGEPGAGDTTGDGILAPPPAPPRPPVVESGAAAALPGLPQPAQGEAAKVGKDGKGGKDGKKEPLSITFFGNKPWHPTENPVAWNWLPTAGNLWLNEYIGTIKANMELARDDPKRLAHAFLRVLPQSLFVLLPIFALLLKVVLVFKRRLYMEHLMVAIHSHTFIYMGILVAITFSWVAERWPAGWTNPWWMLMGFAIAWLPINLFLTQKRVYKQRWWGAPIAFSIISTLYLCLVSFTTFGALVASLVNL